MDEATQSRMFEPFFTTKPVGQGTGLGLSMVHGIVEQSRGAIRVRSAPGEGTAIAIHLPQLAADEQARSAAGPAEPSEPVRATILLVEDEPPVRQLGRRVLERLGHTVLEADGASSALAIEAGHPGPIHLLITDLVMPGMNGRDLAERLVTRRPSMRVLFLSGYLAPDLEFAEGPLRDARAMLKPFSVEGLRETVGRLLRDAAG
jgi:CheY-like chemotaxis protein